MSKGKKLGIPYMGSKRALSDKIINYILEHNPNTKYIYDVFGGGGAISFEALQRPQIEKVFYNEKNTGVANLLKKIRDEGITDDFYRWISKEEFHKLKNGDSWISGLAKICYSFGNNQRGYMFSKDVEEYKKQYHEVVVNNIDHTDSMSEYCMKYVFDKYGVSCNLQLSMPTEIYYQERRLNIFKQLTEFKKNCKKIQDNVGALRKIQQLNVIQQLEQLERLQQLERLEQLEQLGITNLDYKDVIFETPAEETIIYLDPPYIGTETYQEGIEHGEFYNWIESLPYKVYLSSYESKLYEVASFEHRSTLSATNNSKKVVEKLFCNQEE